MSSDRYPLHAAERLRSTERAQAELALARAVAERAAAQAELDALECTLRSQLERAQVAETGQARTLTALELQREAAFALRNADQARALRERIAAERARLSGCDAALRAAQDALGRAHAGEQVFERDHARFDARQRRAQERGEQVELDERAAGSRNDRGR